MASKNSQWRILRNGVRKKITKKQREAMERFSERLHKELAEHKRSGEPKCPPELEGTNIIRELRGPI